jgi:hypothetical protein
MMRVEIDPLLKILSSKHRSISCALFLFNPENAF